jgi:hypothetical protein
MEMGIVNQIGVEIEGGFRSSDEEYTGFDCESDGSVSCTRGYEREYVSHPHKDLVSLERHLKELYGGVIEINSSMGLHVHVSMKDNTHYWKLSSMKFYKWFVQELTNSNLYRNNSTLRTRLAGNRYCQKINNSETIDDQLMQTDKGGSRYHVINFCKNYHGTIEFRIFPAMNTHTEVMEAIKFVVSSVNKYLTRNGNMTIEEGISLPNQRPRTRILSDTVVTQTGIKEV